MEPNQVQLITPSQSKLKYWPQIFIGVIILFVLVGGLYYYFSHKKTTKNMEPQTSVFNDKAAYVLTKDFNYPSEKSTTIYALPHQMGGSLSYKIFINEHLLDSGQPKFGGGGSGPIDTSVFKNGLNTLRLEVDPHPETGEFDKDSACDVAVIGANAGDIASTMISENENILARVTCPIMYVDKEVAVKAAEEKKGQIPMTKEDYDAWFKKDFPKNYEAGDRTAKVIVGPFALTAWTAHDEVNPSADLYSLKIPNIQGNKDRIRVEFTKVLTKKGKNVMVNDSFSTGSFFRGIEMTEAITDVSDELKESMKDYYHGYVSSPSILDVVAGDFEFAEGFSGYEGKIMVSLPLTDGGTYEKELPFVLK